MSERYDATLVNDFLGSTHVFATGLSQAVEEKLLREVTGGQVTFPQFKLLRLVSLQGPHMLGDVAGFLGISPAGASKAVDKLVRRKLLRRSEAHPDRRAICLSLTEASRRLLSDYAEAKECRLSQLFAGVSPAELSRTTGLLDKLAAGLLDHEAIAGELCMDCGVYFRDECLLRELLPRTCFYLQQRARGQQAVAGESSGGRRARVRRARPAPEAAR